MEQVIARIVEAAAMETESTSFNPRTWVSPAPPADSVSQIAPEPVVSEAPPAKRPTALWVGGSVIGLAAMAGLALLVPWGAFFGKPGAEAHQSAPAPVAAAAPMAAPRYDTRIFPAADMNELGLSLEEMGIDTGDAYFAAEEVIAALGTMEPMTVTVELDSKGAKPAIHSLTAELENGAAIRLIRAGDGGFKRESVVETAQVRVRQVGGTIKHNIFYLSAVEAGIPNSLVSDFTKAFAFDIDWGQIKPGDRFSATWEENVTRAGREVEPPRLIAVEYETDGIKRSFYAFTPPDEAEPRWFDEGGQGNARSLMRTPVDGARITSRFGVRKHPIYNIQKAHNGVDFAAPTGTPIFAAGKGTVIFQAMAGGAGNLIKIDHGDGLETRYMHLNAFAEGQGVGASVMQGQVIGYVGTTGGSTGPHLHFEIRTDGNYVDPLSFENTVTEALTGAELRMYLAQRKATSAEIAAANSPKKPAAKPAAKPKPQG
ncbi:peptidoglycan DD-metalloendopeptidase family protein [Porphyrobacter sp. AAP60]|uniref:peptidoglycan DD-metalloendopeptidase family protein n=1 Tax=Porphyrobacter sp. AAP60 TaxID=1523423 RepID=UPI0006B970EA|nr:peptidoglycan DD-metalloendopeptidase family protein [Porphyrobacter sp. AAP60]